MNRKKSAYLSGLIILGLFIVLFSAIFAIDSISLFLILPLIFWFLMLADCLQKEEKDFPLQGTHEKLIWSITLIFLNIAGAFLYFILVFGKDNINSEPINT